MRTEGELGIYSSQPIELNEGQIKANQNAAPTVGLLDHCGDRPPPMIGTGHDACASDPYVAGFHPPRNPGWSSPVPYHPTHAGMDAIAQALDAEIGR